MKTGVGTGVSDSPAGAQSSVGEERDKYVIVPYRRFKMFSCNECGRYFKANSDMKRHSMLVHGKQRPFECVECGARFGIRGDMNRFELPNRAKNCLKW